MNKESDVIDAYSTDGLIEKFNLVVLEDDKQFFLPYQAVPIVNNRIIKEYPEVEAQLTILSEHLNDETMRALNYQVDEEGKTPSKVAKDFLIAQGLIKK